jgi:sigma-E factor negative regulatory protein RseA
MSEHFDEQISEFIDDEMSPEQCEFFVRRLQRDDEARSRYMRYQLIGAAVRGEHIQQNAPELRRRLAAALENDTEASSSQAGSFFGSRFVAGAGIAAGFALFAAIGWGIATLERQSPDPYDEFATTTARSPSMLSIPSMPRDAGAFAGAPAPVTGLQYFVHHAGYSLSFNRTLQHSSILAAPEEEAVLAHESVPVE